MDYNSQTGSPSVEGGIHSHRQEGIKVRGTKGLMEGLRDILGTEIEDAIIDETNENSIVNAKRKEELGITRNDITMDGDNTLEIDDSLFN
jgi:hypothetical protein